MIAYFGEWYMGEWTKEMKNEEFNMTILILKHKQISGVVMPVLR